MRIPVRVFMILVAIYLAGCATPPPAHVNATVGRAEIDQVIEEKLKAEKRAQSAEIPSKHRSETSRQHYEAFSRRDARITPPAAGTTVFRSITLEHSDSLELHFIDVGQGDATLIRCPGGESILIDAGSTSGAEPEPIRDYMHEQLIGAPPQVNTLIITHPDVDHYNLLPVVLDGADIRQVFYVGRKSDYRSDFWDWLHAIPANRRTRLTKNSYDKPSAPNQKISCGQASVFIMAAAVESNFSSKNTQSIVLMIRYRNFEAILTGDATKDTEEAILARFDRGWLKADLLKVGHHGSLATSTTENWADAVRPEIAVVSAGWENSYGHPRSEIIDRLKPFTSEWEEHSMVSAIGSKNAYEWRLVSDFNEAIFCTSTSGTTVISTKGDGGYDVTWFDYGE